MWYIHKMEYYSVIRSKEVTAFAATWMDLEIIMLSEVSQTMRHQYQMLSLSCDELLCRTDTDSQTLKNIWFPRETGWGIGECTGGRGMEML